MKDFLSKLAEYTVLRGAESFDDKSTQSYGSVFSGMLGEARLSEWLNNNRISAYQNRILTVCGRDYEMDFLVVVGKIVYAVEVKNWHGRITPTRDNKYYVQSNSKGSIKHPNTVEKTKRFAGMLAAQLAADGFGDVEVRPLTVFVNGHGMLDRRILADGAIYMDDLGVHTFVDADKGEEIEGIADYLRRLPSWDKLVLSDGNVVKGKLVTRSLKLLDSAKQERHILLAEVASLRVESNRFIQNLSKITVKFLSGKTEELYSETAKIVYKNPAKNFNESSVPLSRVKAIYINYR